MNSNPTFVAQEYPELRLSKEAGNKAIAKVLRESKVVLKSGRETRVSASDTVVINFVAAVAVEPAQLPELRKCRGAVEDFA